MNAKEYLNELVNLDRRLERLLLRREELAALSTRCTSNLTGVPPGGGNGRKLENSVSNIIETEDEIEREISNLLKQRKDLFCKLNKIGDERLAMILELRYLKGMQWPEIECVLTYSKTHCLRLHKQAIEELQKVLDKDGTK